CSKRLRRKPVFFNKKRSLKLQQISLERKSKGCLNTFETASFLFTGKVGDYLNITCMPSVV
ncbi:MAG: hypothetical protein WBB45_21330, partial [Cyclobacteriaceae bacterium]